MIQFKRYTRKPLPLEEASWRWLAPCFYVVIIHLFVTRRVQYWEPHLRLHTFSVPFKSSPSTKFKAFFPTNPSLDFVMANRGGVFYKEERLLWKLGSTGLSEVKDQSLGTKFKTCEDIDKMRVNKKDTHRAIFGGKV